MTTLDVLNNQILLITLKGDLDNYKANQLRAEVSSFIFSGQVNKVIWNLEYLSFMDSAGIGLILGRMRDLTPFDGETIILNPSPTMEQIFSFSGLHSFVRKGSVEEVVAEFGGILYEK